MFIPRGGVKLLVAVEALRNTPDWITDLPGFHMTMRLGTGRYPCGDLAGEPIVAAEVVLRGVEYLFNGENWVRPIPQETGLPLIWDVPYPLPYALEVSSIDGELLWRCAHYCKHCLRNTGRPTLNQPRWVTRSQSMRFLCPWCVRMWVHQFFPQQIAIA